MIIPERACSMQGRIYFSKSSMPTKAETPTMLWKKAALSSQGPWPFKISCVMMWGNKLFTVFSRPKKMHNLVISYTNCVISMHPKPPKEKRRNKEAYHKQTAFDQRRCLLCENVEYEFVEGILNLGELCIICLAPYHSSTAAADPIYRSRRQFRHRNLLEKLLGCRVVSNHQCVVSAWNG